MRIFSTHRPKVREETPRTSELQDFLESSDSESEESFACDEDNVVVEKPKESHNNESGGTGIVGKLKQKIASGRAMIRQSSARSIFSSSSAYQQELHSDTSDSDSVGIELSSETTGIPVAHQEKPSQVIIGRDTSTEVNGGEQSTSNNSQDKRKKLVRHRSDPTEMLDLASSVSEARNHSAHKSMGQRGDDAILTEGSKRSDPKVKKKRRPLGRSRSDASDISEMVRSLQPMMHVELSESETEPITLEGYSQVAGATECVSTQLGTDTPLGTPNEQSIVSQKSASLFPELPTSITCTSDHDEISKNCTSSTDLHLSEESDIEEPETSIANLNRGALPPKQANEESGSTHSGTSKRPTPLIREGCILRRASLNAAQSAEPGEELGSAHSSTSKKSTAPTRRGRMRRRTSLNAAQSAEPSVNQSSTYSSTSEDVTPPTRRGRMRRRTSIGSVQSADPSFNVCSTHSTRSKASRGSTRRGHGRDHHKSGKKSSVEQGEVEAWIKRSNDSDHSEHRDQKLARSRQAPNTTDGEAVPIDDQQGMALISESKQQSPERHSGHNAQEPEGKEDRREMLMKMREHKTAGCSVRQESLMPTNHGSGTDILTPANTDGSQHQSAGTFSETKSKHSKGKRVLGRMQRRGKSVQPTVCTFDIDNEEPHIWSKQSGAEKFIELNISCHAGDTVEALTSISVHD